MNVLKEKNISCPCCGESISVQIDCSEDEQEYIEYCRVCCQPIKFIVRVDRVEDIYVNVFHENEQVFLILNDAAIENKKSRW
ncbi:hypothetical protein MNBD_GAMMA25-1514 [hydrothermal vent metagenome]|uniref:CPXCG motif-containing cysteine-rich protein n=1 Tax=hydrothermal vent metagenome TaxID=652676 RepID=A0A3B1B683_9ZZZZ